MTYKLTIMAYGISNSTWQDAVKTSMTAPYGFSWINNTAVTNGSWFAIMAIADSTVVAAIAGKGVPTSVSGMPLPTGVVLMGDFTSIQLTSGQVIAYKNEQ